MQTALAEGLQKTSIIVEVIGPHHLYRLHGIG